MNTLKFKDFIGEFEFDPEARVFHGRVVSNGHGHLRRRLGGRIGERPGRLDRGYLEFRKEMNRPPNKPSSGRFNVGVAPETHQLAAAAAKDKGQSLNPFVAEALEREAKAALI